MMEKRGLLSSGEDVPVLAGKVGVDHSEVLEAIRELKDLIENNPSPASQTDVPELTVLRGQLYELHNHIEETKREIASIRRPGEEEDRLTTAAMELDAIVETTEQATHKILNATEEIDELVEQLQERSSDVKANEMLTEVSNKTIDILEACNFQDLSGQRTTKVIRTINYLEERIMSMIEIWGEEEFSKIEVEEIEISEDEKLLGGPQSEEKAISQDDIDALFD